MRKSFLPVTVEYNITNTLNYHVFKHIAQLLVVFIAFREFFTRKSRSLSERYDPRHILSTCASFAFLVTTHTLTL